MYKMNKLANDQINQKNTSINSDPSPNVMTWRVFKQ